MSTLLLQAFAKLPPPEETQLFTFDGWPLLLAALFAGAFIGFAISGILTAGKRRDEYQAGYLAGFQEGNSYRHNVESMQVADAITPPTIKISPRIPKHERN